MLAPDGLESPLGGEPLGEGLILGSQLWVSLSEGGDTLQQIKLGHDC